MEEPLLAGFGKKLTHLQIPHQCTFPTASNLPDILSTSTPSSIKEFLIFGSPATAPTFLHQPVEVASVPGRECLSEDPNHSTVIVDGNDELCRSADTSSHEGKQVARSFASPKTTAIEQRLLRAMIDSPRSSTQNCTQVCGDLILSSPYMIEQEQTKKDLFRSRTAPAIFGPNRHPCKRLDFNIQAPPSLSSPLSVVSQAFIGLMVYLSVGMLIYTLRGQEFSGATTNGFFDALYFCIVTMCTIGYGDITPVTPAAKLFSCAFVLVGLGFIDVLLSAMVSYVLQRQETLLLNSVAAGPHETAKNYLVDVKKGRMRVRSKVILAFGVVVTCIGVGTFMMHFLERLGWLDAFYLSCMSVTTVGYGDHAFKTLSGRMFASIWLLVSTLAVTQSFLYLAEARIDKRHRLIAKWVLEKEMTLADLLAADIDNDGSVSKSDFVVYKLKEMGKVDESEITEICKQFSRLDPENSGKITLSCLIDLHKASTLKK